MIRSPQRLPFELWADVWLDVIDRTLVSRLGLAGADDIRRTIHDLANTLYDAGFSEDDAFSFITVLEEVNPNVPEELAFMTWQRLKIAHGFLPTADDKFVMAHLL